ncbi:MAG: hypothetical protein U1F43_19845 [Myxococcota bacterium]
MHTLILTLAFVLASPGPSPDRADLLRRFDAARARLASADLATLERAVLMLERASSGGDPDGGHRGDGWRRRGGEHADCVAREVARFKKDGYADTTSADRANEACQGVDGAFLGALVDVLTRDGYSLTTSVSRAREYATDARVASKGLASSGLVKRRRPARGTSAPPGLASSQN